MMSDEIANLSISQLTGAYRSREITPVEVTNYMFDRIEQINPSINAIYYVDRQGALSSAEASETRWRNNDPVGGLDGVPTTVKDALATIGMPVHRGSVASLVETPDYDHPTVARMKESGAIILGKNTMSDYGIIASGVSSQHGVTRNPWNTECSTGASSSGAAASVAAGIGPMAIGTDIVGSIRVPASYCGLVGHKPSQGRVPYYFPNSPSLVAGPMTRTVQDAAIFMDVLTQRDGRDFTALPHDEVDYAKQLNDSSIAGKKALYIPNLGFGLPVDSSVASAVETAVINLEAEGLKVETLPKAPFSRDADRVAEQFYRIRCLAEYSQVPEEEMRKSSVIWDWTRKGAELSAVEFYQVFSEVQKLREATARLIDGFDFLLLPSTPIPAHGADEATPLEGELFAPWCNTFLFNLTEQPAISLNCGFTNSGLPIGFQIVGQRFEDLATMQLAKMYEDLRGMISNWPKLI